MVTGNSTTINSSPSPPSLLTSTTNNYFLLPSLSQKQISHYSPRLSDWPLEVKTKETLPDQRQHGMIHFCNHGLIGPTIDGEVGQKRCPRQLHSLNYFLQTIKHIFHLMQSIDFRLSMLQINISKQVM